MRLVKRILKVLGITILAAVWCLFLLALSLPTLLSIPQYFLKPKVEAEIAAIKASGAPVTLRDLAGPKIPDSENGAILYRKAFRLMESRSLEADLSALSEAGADGRRGPEWWSRADRLVARSHDILDLVEEAQSRPKCRFPVEWDKGMAATYPHLSPLRDLSRLMAVHAEWNAREGRMDEAVRCLDLGFRLSNSLKDEPGLVSQLVRWSLIRTTSESLHRSLQYSDVSEEQAKRLYETLSAIDVSDSYAVGIEGDRAQMISLSDTMRERPDMLSKVANEHPDEKPSHIRPSGMWRSMIYADELFYLRTMDRWMEFARAPYRDIKREPVNPLAEPDIPRYALITVIMLPVLRLEKQDNAIAEVSGSRVLLALMAYKDRYGAYPDSLDQLRAKLGWEIPEDPFSGRDFIYRREGNGFLLYSIGEDLKDNGGREKPDEKPAGDARPGRPTSSSTEDPYDIVWRMER
jgi:hypothetical protein